MFSSTWTKWIAQIPIQIFLATFPLAHLVWPPRPGLLRLPLLSLLPALSPLPCPSPRRLAGRGRAEHDVRVLLQERGPHESPLREALGRLQGEAGPDDVVDVKGADWGGKKRETVFRLAIYMFDLSPPKSSWVCLFLPILWAIDGIALFCNCYNPNCFLHSSFRSESLEKSWLCICFGCQALFWALCGKSNGVLRPGAFS